MPSRPTVDVDLFVRNGATTAGAAIESVLAQSWSEVTSTSIDAGSTDGTLNLLHDYANKCPRVRVKRARCDSGLNIHFQRACWYGNEDYVMPKFGDDTIAHAAQSIVPEEDFRKELRTLAILFKTARH